MVQIHHRPPLKSFIAHRAKKLPALQKRPRKFSLSVRLQVNFIGWRLTFYILVLSFGFIL
ncbi:MAG: hypothetical protein COX39_00560 [Candidatus Nealsonbacteria bacterium CG23_combo_of_CG06-09_8_20_14_all_40_13]|uniref:Uncharacterized protein n=1 Tax=Candidatus Nealsonbacteria bacterium CG23_combo_of_CG06-09_8_20_14_all_40_13 TaxID=1974724 RepID=A0A2G9YTR7_9BACT|nr:MAG: hypothetical protein COX39_00560 [Candidatus Nealsonbacteria bacterium CG23_combo_of_CG06-09_8_20_14_all_40_13]PIR70740.1 MAG: hypothetical protein COU44_03385 [Candidatus Nealsonbacteria bacterium CG10_big_fil_rev_8_21_14_0_10_40_24]PIU43227.1 MAG: hypothetical protein COS97_02190 [Candidatus Nealsonbacteria bacterium CG07_land_8_20_14_0_80_40_10]